MRELINRICNDPLMSKEAAIAIKKEIDRIYGYSKYDISDVQAELKKRLYSLVYLGGAIVRLIDHKKIDEETKKRLAFSYLSFLKLYEERELPEMTYSLWGQDPIYSIELAVFLDSLGERSFFSDYDLLLLIILFERDSSKKAKESFLKILIEQLNENPELLDYLSAIAKELYPFSPLQISKNKSHNSSLLMLLQPIYGHRTKHISLSPLVRFERLTPIDVLWMLDNLGFMSIYGIPQASEELCEILLKMDYPLKNLLDKLILKGKERKFSYTLIRKIKGLLKVLVKHPSAMDQEEELITILRELLAINPPSELRLSVYKFLYEKTTKKELLKKASKDPSKKVRNWAKQLLTKK